MTWIVVAVIAVVVIGLLIAFSMKATMSDYLCHQFGNIVHRTACDAIPNVRLLHWEETSTLLQVASFRCPGGRVLPDHRPVDGHLLGLAYSGLSSIIGELAPKCQGLGSSRPDERWSQIKAASSLANGLIDIQRQLRSGLQLPADDYALGYLYGFTLALARHRQLDFIQQLVTILVVYRRLYGQNAAVQHLSVTWDIAEDHPRARARLVGWREAQAFLRDKTPPLGLAEDAHASDTASCDRPAPHPSSQGTVDADMHSRLVAAASEVCRSLITAQTEGFARPQMELAFVQGYVAGFADGVSQCMQLSEEEALALACALFHWMYGIEDGPRLLQRTMEVKERSRTHEGRMRGGQDAVAHQRGGKLPSGLRDFLISKTSERKR